MPLQSGILTVGVVENCYFRAMQSAPIVVTDATLSVNSPDGCSHRFYLESRVNRIVIRGVVRYYKFTCQKGGL